MASNDIQTYTPDEALKDTDEKGFNYRPIHTQKDVLVEMNVIYKLSRRGKIETQDYARYVNGLNSMAGVIKDSDIEKRIKEIEELLSK